MGLSQAELAKMAGTDARQIRRYEAGDVQPSLAQAKAIARALEVSLDVLAGSVQTLEIQGDWWMAWRPHRDPSDLIVQPVEIRPRGLDLELVCRGEHVNTSTFPEGWRVSLRLAGETGYIGWYTSDGLYGTVTLDNYVDTLVGGWMSLPVSRQGGIGYIALARTTDAAKQALLRYAAANAS